MHPVYKALCNYAPTCQRAFQARSQLWHTGNFATLGTQGQNASFQQNVINKPCGGTHTTSCILAVTANLPCLLTPDHFELQQ